MARIKKSELMSMLYEELAEIENPRHRGSSADRSTPPGEFEPPPDLLLDDDAIETGACDGVSDSHHDNQVANVVLGEINSLASKIADLTGEHQDMPDWVDFKLSSSLTNLRDIHLYLKGHR